MRYVYLVFLLLFVGVIAAFAILNFKDVPVHYWIDRSRDFNFPLLIGATYLLGMVSGWTVVGLLRRSIRHVSHDFDLRSSAQGDTKG